MGERITVPSRFDFSPARNRIKWIITFMIALEALGNDGRSHSLRRSFAGARRRRGRSGSDNFWKPPGRLASSPAAARRDDKWLAHAIAGQSGENGRLGLQLIRRRRSSSVLAFHCCSPPMHVGRSEWTRADASMAHGFSRSARSDRRWVSGGGGGGEREFMCTHKQLRR